MFRFLKLRSTKKRSILDKQRVSRGKSTSSRSTKGQASWTIFAKWIVVASLLLAVWVLGVRAYDKVRVLADYFNKAIVLTPNEWKIEVVSNSGTPLPEDVRRSIFKVSEKILKNGSHSELALLRSQVESQGMLDGVRVIRPVSDTIIVSAEIRRPSLLVSLGQRTRFLTSDATVYGDASDNSGNPFGSHPSVIVAGIFDARSQFAVDGSLRVITTEEEKRHLLDAIEIWQRSGDAGIELRQISFQKFRGFSVVLADETEIVVGLRPFEFKLKKLRGILDGLRRDGIVAARIELDYEGKAFIKERKL